MSYLLPPKWVILLPTNQLFAIKIIRIYLFCKHSSYYRYKPLYTTIATVTMNLIVAVAIVLLNLYVTACISY